MNIKKQGKVTMIAVIAGLSLYPSFAFSDGKHSHEMKDQPKMVHDQNMSDVAQNISKILVDYSDAVSRNDIEAMGSFLAGETFSVVEGKHANWGWQDYRDNHLKLEFSSDKFKLLNYEMSNIRVIEGHMLSYAVFDTKLSYELDGVKNTKKGMGTAILEKKKEGWIIRHIHTS